MDDDIPETYSRYPRTLAEAFKGPDYADPIERPARGYGAAWWACMVAIGAAALAIAWVAR